MSTLYDHDLYTWTQEQAALLRDGKVQDIDLVNLAEEIDSLGISQRHALESCFRVLLMRLLKWRYQPLRRQTSRSWYGTITEHRARIAELLRDSPSLRRLVPDVLGGAYPRARRVASHETRLPLDTFPVTCPWTVEQVVSEDFWPEDAA